MRFALEQRFTADVDTVESALTDPDFLSRLGQLPNLDAPELLHQETDGAVVRQRLRYRFKGELSPAVTAVVDPSRLTWVEEVTIDTADHSGHHRIVPDHYSRRLECSYDTRLRREGEHTLRLVEGEVKVRFPLVGGSVERAIVSGLTEHVDAEPELLEAWLRERA